MEVGGTKWGGDPRIYACILTVVEFIGNLGGREKKEGSEMAEAEPHHTQTKNGALGGAGKGPWEGGFTPGQKGA